MSINGQNTDGSSVSFAKSPAKELRPLGRTVPGGVDWTSGMIEDQLQSGDYTNQGGDWATIVLDSMVLIVGHYK